MTHFVGTGDMTKDGGLSGDLLEASQSLHEGAIRNESRFITMLNLANSAALARSAMVVAGGTGNGLRAIDIMTGRLPADRSALETLHESIGKGHPQGSLRSLRTVDFYTEQDVERAAEHALDLINLVARMNPNLQQRLRQRLEQSVNNTTSISNETAFRLGR